MITSKPTPKPDLYIGIDSGTTTGISGWKPAERKLVFVESMMIHRAMERVRFYKSIHYVMVLVEDARLATFGRGGHIDMLKAQGAGSIKRDAAIWQDFLTDMKIPFQMVRPAKAFTKLDADKFKRTTGWMGKTNNHARDSAMIVYGR